MRTIFYRYIIDPDNKYEAKNTREKRIIKTTNPYAQGTWHTTDCFEDPGEAQQKLALSALPTHRIGPILPDQMPDFDIPLRPVAPVGGSPGGGVEALVKDAVHIFGLFEFKTGQWELPKD